jgi:hypothetical protein
VWKLVALTCAACRRKRRSHSPRTSPCTCAELTTQWPSCDRTAELESTLDGGCWRTAGSGLVMPLMALRADSARACHKPRLATQCFSMAAALATSCTVDLCASARKNVMYTGDVKDVKETYTSEAGGALSTNASGSVGRTSPIGQAILNMWRASDCVADDIRSAMDVRERLECI